MGLFQIIFVTCLLTTMFVRGGTAGELPKTINKCRKNGSGACMKEMAQRFLPLMAKGVPEYKIQALEPLKLGIIKNPNKQTINFNFSNVKIFGLTTARIDDLSIDQNKRKITLAFTNTGHMEADYVADGRLLILPVTGNGKCFFKLIDIKYVFKIHYEVVKGEDGKDHWKITRHKVTYTPSDVDFKFTNLFNGNKQLSDAVHTFGNQNWKEIFAELGTPFMSKLTGTIVEIIGKVFTNIAVKDMFQD